MTSSNLKSPAASASGPKINNPPLNQPNNSPSNQPPAVQKPFPPMNAAAIVQVPAASTLIRSPALVAPPKAMDSEKSIPGSDGSDKEAVDLTAEIERSFVSLSMEEVIEMPFVRPYGGYLVGSLLQRRRFSAKSMEELFLEKLWNPLYRVQMQEVDHNLFLFGFAHRMDLEKVIREGPWRFNKHILLLQEIADPAQASRAILRKIPIWVHIMKVPPSWLTETAARAIWIKLGPIIDVDPDSFGSHGLGFLRVRVALEAAAPLPRSIKIGMGSAGNEVEFLYERLENYCFRCGLVDHTAFDCMSEPVKPGEKDWSKDLTALPPIKRVRRQQPASQSKSWMYGSVSPIAGRAAQGLGKENIVLQSSELNEVQDMLVEDRSKKRTFEESNSVPPGFENFKPARSPLGQVVDNMVEDAKAKDVVNEQVGEGAHLLE